jgi:hypothetical protein
MAEFLEGDAELSSLSDDEPTTTRRIKHEDNDMVEIKKALSDFEVPLIS